MNKMDMKNLIECMTYVFVAIGVIAFLVSVITQVIKDMPGIQDIQTGVVALAVSFVLCPSAVVIACQYFGIVVVWYYVFAAFIAAFIVYLVATGGWERVSDIWSRTKYKKHRKGDSV